MRSPYYEKALQAARSLGQPESEMNALLGLSAALCRTRRAAGCAEAAEQAYELAQPEGRADVQGAALLRLAEAQRGQGHLGQAELAYQQALPLLRSGGDRATTADVLLRRGETLEARDLEDEARPCYEEALALARSMNDRRREAAALHLLATGAERSGDAAAAECGLRGIGRGRPDDGSTARRWSRGCWGSDVTSTAWQRTERPSTPTRRPGACWPTGATAAGEAEALLAWGQAHWAEGECGARPVMLRAGCGDRGRVGAARDGARSDHANMLGTIELSTADLDAALREHERALALAVGAGDAAVEAERAARIGRGHTRRRGSRSAGWRTTSRRCRPAGRRARRVSSAGRRWRWARPQGSAARTRSRGASSSTRWPPGRRRANCAGEGLARAGLARLDFAAGDWSGAAAGYEAALAALDDHGQVARGRGCSTWARRYPARRRERPHRR